MGWNSGAIEFQTKRQKGCTVSGILLSQKAPDGSWVGFSAGFTNICVNFPGAALNNQYCHVSWWSWPYERTTWLLYVFLQWAVYNVHYLHPDLPDGFQLTPWDALSNGKRHDWCYSLKHKYPRIQNALHYFWLDFQEDSALLFAALAEKEIYRQACKR